MKQKLELPVLTTTHYFLRHPYLTDNQSVYTMRSSEANARYLDRVLAKNLQEADTFIEKILTSIETGETYYWMITTLDGAEVLGSICFWNFNKKHNEAEIGFELLPEHQGKGIIQEILPAVIRFGFEILHLKKIHAEVDAGNAKSITLLTKNGFTVSGISREGTTLYELKNTH